MLGTSYHCAPPRRSLDDQRKQRTTNRQTVRSQKGNRLVRLLRHFRIWVLFRTVSNGGWKEKMLEDSSSSSIIIFPCVCNRPVPLQASSMSMRTKSPDDGRLLTATLFIRYPAFVLPRHFSTTCRTIDHLIVRTHFIPLKGLMVTCFFSLLSSRRGTVFRRRAPRYSTTTDSMIVETTTHGC